MEILSCRYGSDEAEKAFRLRYQVYGNEYKFNEPTIDHENSRYVDPLDEHPKIHEDLVIAAAAHGKSLNQWVAETLERETP